MLGLVRKWNFTKKLIIHNLRTMRISRALLPPPLGEGRDFDDLLVKIRGGVLVQVFTKLSLRPHPTFFGHSPQNCAPPARGGQTH